MEQVEFCNVVVLNKQDLVSKEQLQDILDKISILNPKARVLQSEQSKIDVRQILDTRLFDRALMEEESVMIAATKVEAKEKVEAEDAKSCCLKSIAEDGKKCCKSKAKNGQCVESGLSQVLLGVVANNNPRSLTRHEKRFGITSFVYRSRRPFHPGRLYDSFLEPYFILRYQEDDEGPELRSYFDKLQKQAASKQAARGKLIGELLRSKGFVWIASSNGIMGGWQQAGNILRIEGEGMWMTDMRAAWEGTQSEELVRKDMQDENGKELPHGDRRQELVFIGTGLRHEAIQKTLDQCLLNDEEMDMGPEKWEETMAPTDKIKLSLDDEDEEDEENEDGEGEDDPEEEEEAKQDDGGPAKKQAKRDESNGK